MTPRFPRKLAALVLGLALATPALADVILLETYTRTRTRPEADRVAASINSGRVPGWSLAEVYYDAPTRSFVVQAARDDDPPPTDVPPVEIPRGPLPSPAPPG